MRFRHATLLVATIGILAPEAPARDIEPTAASFLDIDVDPRSAAMAGAGIAGPGQLASIYTNPAGLFALTHQRAGLMHAAWFQGLSLEWAGYGASVGPDGGAAVSATFLRSPSLDRFDPFGNSDGSFHVYDAAITAGYGHRFYRTASAGIAVKAIHQSVDDYTATGFAADLGVSVGMPWGRLAARASNIGPEMKHAGDAFPLPTALSLGVEAPVLGERVVLGFVASRPFHYYDEMRIGVEARPLDEIALRAGYRYVLDRGEADQLTALSYGVGFAVSGIHIDYAFQPFDVLGDTHRVGLSAAFGRGARPDATRAERTPRPADAAPPVPEAARASERADRPEIDESERGPVREERPREEPKAETIVPAPEPKPAAAAADQKPSVEPPDRGKPGAEEAAREWLVVAGIHRSRISALQELRSLRLNGLEGGNLRKRSDGRYRVVVGHFDSYDDARKWIDGPGVRHGKLSFSIVPAR